MEVALLRLETFCCTKARTDCQSVPQQPQHRTTGLLLSFYPNLSFPSSSLSHTALLSVILGQEEKEERKDDKNKIKSQEGQPHPV